LSVVADQFDYAAMLDVALSEARKGLAEGGIPIGAAIFDVRGQLWELVTTVAFSRETPRCTVKPTRFATRDADAAIAT